MDPAQILRYLADLAASSSARGSRAAPAGATPETLDLTRAREPCEWLGTGVVLPLARPEGAVGGAPAAVTARYTETVRHLATLDAMQPAEHLLRLGWVVVAGTVTIDDRPTRYCFPLVSQAVRLAPERGRGARPRRRHRAPSAELIARLPRLQAWIGEVVAACGLPPLTQALPPSAAPRSPTCTSQRRRRRTRPSSCARRSG